MDFAGKRLLEFDLDPANQAGYAIVERSVDGAENNAGQAVKDGEADQVNEPIQPAAKEPEPAAEEPTDEEAAGESALQPEAVEPAADAETEEGVESDASSEETSESEQ